MMPPDASAKPVGKMSDLEIHEEIVRIERESGERILTCGAGPDFTAWWDAKWRDRNLALIEEARERKEHSAAAVVRLRFLAGETGRALDAACGEALGWRVNDDDWWNWDGKGPPNPPGDQWCIRRDARNDIPCDEALPHFTAESFEAALREVGHAS